MTSETDLVLRDGIVTGSKKESENVSSVWGISGITDVNFTEGYDPATGIFDKSKTQMEEASYLNYCRLGDPELVRLVLDEGRIVNPRRLEGGAGIEAVIDGSEKVWPLPSLEALLNATNYPLVYQKSVLVQGQTIRPLIIAFKIGMHTADIDYSSDRPIRSSVPFCSDSDTSEPFGYHLEPGIVRVGKILEIQEFEAEAGRTFAKPFRLVDITDTFIPVPLPNGS